MSATCEKCSGTGQLPGSAYLDCIFCDVAMIRVGLEAWSQNEGFDVNNDELWAIFKYGQSKALEEAAKVCDEKYATRAASGHPREASTARALAEQIRELK